MDEINTKKTDKSVATKPARRKYQRKKSNSQLTTEDWITAATNVLAVGGIDAVRVEPLAAKLKVTKGSFYHHFAGRPALHRAMLSSWRQQATKTIIDRLKDKDLSSAERLKGLFDLPAHGARAKEAANTELAIRLWAKRDPEAKAVVDEVDDQRLKFITSLYEDLGLEKERAGARAYLFYASMMGQALFDVTSVNAELDGVIERLLRP